jgi:hypothetical protein
VDRHIGSMLFVTTAHSISGMEIMKFAKIVVFQFMAILISATLGIGALLLSLKVYDVYLL